MNIGDLQADTDRFGWALSRHTVGEPRVWMESECMGGAKRPNVISLHSEIPGCSSRMSTRITMELLRAFQLDLFVYEGEAHARLHREHRCAGVDHNDATPGGQ